MADLKDKSKYSTGDESTGYTSDYMGGDDTDTDYMGGSDEDTMTGEEDGTTTGNSDEGSGEEKSDTDTT